jgi:beta-mannosidase
MATSHESRVLSEGWTFRRAGEPDWWPATVPGCAHTDLLAAGRIGDPFYRTNEKQLGWIERQDWEWRTTFPIDATDLERERIDLCFDGLDTFADVLLNGQPILRADNMFRRWRVPVSRRLRAGANELLVRCRSPITQTLPAHRALGFELEAINDQSEPRLSVFARKAPYQYGWDWGPRLVTSGIWRPVRLELWDGARIDDLQVIQRELNQERAVLELVLAIEASRTMTARVAAGVTDPGEALAGQARAAAELQLTPGENRTRLTLTIPRPQLWWPSGLGDPHLYRIAAALDSDRRGQVVDARIGLRTVRLVHERDGLGKSFTFEVNGHPVFMKGANWVPPDSFPSRMTRDRYRELLTAAQAAHMNMIRVWGGGVYEDDVFYDLCDELGLLVFQDFMFACSLYPDDEPFVENVRQEAIDNVRRLRNHACLALWAGNNEIETAWHHWGWKIKYAIRGLAPRLWAGYQRLFHQLLPEVVREHDPGRPYTRSSPSANEESHVNERGWGDMHYWGVWHLKLPATAYDDNVSRFMSEYGFQSFPELASVARYSQPQDRQIDSPVMRAHQRHRHGNGLIASYLEQEFPPPRNFEDFLYLGQVLQAEIIKYGAEAHRRAMPGCMGSLYWQLDDCWPVASWSGIDHYGRWKALHFYARRFFAPVLVVVRQEAGQLVIHGISDRLVPTLAHLRLRVLTFAGQALAIHESDLSLPGNRSTLIHRAALHRLLGDHPPGQTLVAAELTEGSTRLSRNLLYLTPTRQQRLPLPDLRLEARPEGRKVIVRVHSPQLARNVWLTTPHPGTFSDNHFDLLPGEATEVAFTPAADLTSDALLESLRTTNLAEVVARSHGAAPLRI